MYNYPEPAFASQKFSVTHSSDGATAFSVGRVRWPRTGLSCCTPLRRSAWQDGVVDDLKRRRRPWKRLFGSVWTRQSAFQLHGVDGMEQPALRRKLGAARFWRSSSFAARACALEACGHRTFGRGSCDRWGMR